MLLLDAFNKDRASLPQPLTNAPPSTTLPLTNAPPSTTLPAAASNPRIQELINEKLKKSEELGMDIICNQEIFVLIDKEYGMMHKNCFNITFRTFWGCTHHLELNSAMKSYPWFLLSVLYCVCF